MGIRARRTRLVATGAATAVFAVTAAVTVATSAEAATVKTVKVRMSDSAITFSGGGASTANGVTTLRPGRYHFHVVAASGDHILQFLSFRNGYTADQAQKDFQTAFEGDVAAVQRIDNGVVFRGGTEATKNQPGDMVVKLPRGEHMAMDVNGDAAALLNMVGTVRKTSRTPSSGTYTAFTFGWGVSKNLPASGTVKFRNQADQPHFMVLQQVKPSTTNRQVRRFIKSGAQRNPKWALKASADVGVVSPGMSQLVDYDLPAGKYFLACFWPDYFNGEPHFVMGMWKLVRLS